MGRGTGCPEEMGGREGRSGPQAVEVTGPPCVRGGDECAHSRGLADTCGLFMGRAEGSWGSTCRGHSGSTAFAWGPEGGSGRRQARPPPPHCRQSPVWCWGRGPVKGRGVFRKTPAALVSGENVWTPGSRLPLGQPSPALRFHPRWVPVLLTPGLFPKHRHTWIRRRHTCSQAHIRAHTCTRMYTLTDTHTCTCTHKCTCSHTCTSTHTLANTNVHTNTHAHAHRCADVI